MVQLAQRLATRRSRVFVSFDFSHDRVLAPFVVEQSRCLGFEIEDWSLKEAAPTTTWRLEAERRIKRCDLVLVMLGAHTHRAPGVRAEVAIARRLEVPLVQVIGYRDSSPTPVFNAGRVYRWNSENLHNLLRQHCR